jgi:hypothetical protein
MWWEERGRGEGIRGGAWNREEKNRKHPTGTKTRGRIRNPTKSNQRHGPTRLNPVKKKDRERGGSREREREDGER